MILNIKIRIHSIAMLFFMLLFSTSCKSGTGDDLEIIDHDSTEVPASKTSTDATVGHDRMNVMTYNILWDKETSGPTQWVYRKESLIHLIGRHHPDLLGMQEGFINQLEFIREETGLVYFGYGTDDGKSEMDNPNKNQSLNPIFYNPERFEILDKGVFWYSDDPDIPNLGYSDTHFRNCVWGKFKEKGIDNRVLFVFNTHFSLRDEIRLKQAEMLLEKVIEIAGEQGYVIITGDFNADPIRDASYRRLIDSSRPRYVLDTKNLCTNPPIGPKFNGSGLKVYSRTSGYAVDHIFVRNLGPTSQYKIIDDYEGDYYPSDHFPVLTVIETTF